MAKTKRDLSEPQSLYDRDFFAWTQQQAALLRRGAAGGPSADLDFENLAEEIESWGKRDRRALAADRPHHRPPAEAPTRAGGRAPCRLGEPGRRPPLAGATILADSPGLKGELKEILSESYEDGRRLAARSLRGALGLKALPETCPYSLDAILDRDWWPRSAGGER